MTFRLRAHYLLLALLTQLWGCSSTSDEKPIYISQNTNTALQSYFATIGSVGSGAFAVSPDGRYAFYSYCSDSYCGSISMSQDALIHCKGLAGTECVILANGSNTVRPYRVSSAGPGETVPPLKGPDIEQRVDGNTLSGFHSDGAQWKIFFDTNHQAHVIDGSRKLLGTWQISGDRLCLDYPGSNDDWCGEFRISSFLGGKQTLDVYRDGKLWQSMDMPTTVPGNPWNL